MIRNKDSGSIGDVFTDGAKFGNIEQSEGMMIYDNRGRLLTWFATVESLEDDNYLISITPVVEINNSNVLTPRQPVEILNGESIFVEVNTVSICDFYIDIFTHNGNNISRIVELPSGKSTVRIMTIDDNFPPSGNIIGTLGCDSNLREIDLQWHQVGHRIISDDFFLLVDSDKDNTISIIPDFEGQESRFYNLEIQGAASRIASLESSLAISPGDDIEILIEPEGLLVPGMIARGELVLVDNFGIELRIPITLEAKSTFNSNVLFSWFAEPGNGLLVISILLGFSIFTGGSNTNRDDHSESE